MGDISSVIVKKADEEVVRIPLGQSIAAGIGGIIVAPYAIIPAAIAAVGFHATIELETKDGAIVGIDGKPVKK